MKFRALRNTSHRWKYYLLLWAIAVYCFCIFADGISYSAFIATRYITADSNDVAQANGNSFEADLLQIQKDENAIDSTEKVYYLPSKRYPNLYIEDIVGEPLNGIADRLRSPQIPKNAPLKIILSWDAGHSAANLGGCLDWNCKFSADRRDLTKADAILAMSMDPEISEFRRPDQYVIFFNQESPVNGNTIVKNEIFFNTTLNFRRDTITSSPYGYTVKLALQSRPKNDSVVDGKLIRNKKKAIAWFVSHCSTHSMREMYTNKLQKFIKVDIYGACGSLKCARGGKCEDVLDTDYYFYIAFENSICKDYVTEKLWSQGFQRIIIPLVLKRELVEPYAPPKSFIAVDDFNTVEELARYLNYLMNNKTAYMEYFNWRKEYKVIFLDGVEHDQLERPWGFCQICRLLWQKPLQKHIIKNFKTFWSESCEQKGSLVRRLIMQSALNITTPGINRNL